MKELRASPNIRTVEIMTIVLHILFYVSAVFKSAAASAGSIGPRPQIAEDRGTRNFSSTHSSPLHFVHLFLQCVQFAV